MPEHYQSRRKSRSTPRSHMAHQDEALLQQIRSPLSQQRPLDPRQLPPAQILSLQRTIGNAAVKRLIARHTSTSTSAAPVTTTSPLVKDKLNVVGETHPESDAQRRKEKKYCKKHSGSSHYWKESEFKDRDFEWRKDLWKDERNRVDEFNLRWNQAQSFLKEDADIIQAQAAANLKSIKSQKRWLRDLEVHLANLKSGHDGFNLKPDDIRRKKEMRTALKATKKAWKKLLKTSTDAYQTNRDEYHTAVTKLCGLNPIGGSNLISNQRGIAMHNAAVARKDERGVWKIGENHRSQIAAHLGGSPTDYNLVDKQTFITALNS